jgi:multidrug efflux pump subunit AcrB
MGTGLSRPRAVLEAASKTATARLLSMLCILSVFVSSLFMAGTAAQLFVPLSLAVGSAMVASYVLSSTVVPVMSVWMMRKSADAVERKERLKESYGRTVGRLVGARWLVTAGYVAGVGLCLWILAPRLGTELFPSANANQFQIRLRAPTGTRIERTELAALKALEVIKAEAGAGNVVISTGFIGVQPASYPINTIYLWTSGPHEAVLRVALKPDTPVQGQALQERLRARFAKAMPDTTITFEAGDIIGQVLSFGSPTPIEVAIQGPAMPANRQHAEKVRSELTKLPYLRDLHAVQSFDYPTLEVAVNRERAGQYGLTASGVARSLVAATSSSRFVDPNYWRDPVSGNAFQIQVEIPQSRMASEEDVRSLPVMPGGGSRPLLGDVADVKLGTTAGEIDRYNMQRVVSFTANVHGMPLGEAAEGIREAISRAGDPPRGVTVNLRGQIPPLEETLSGLRLGLALATGAIFLLLAAAFQSVRLAFAIVMMLPAVLLGVVAALLLTGTTLNVQSFTGAIMAMGIAVANAILLVSFAERSRLAGDSALQAATHGARDRLRAVLMTASAMIAGMVPIALGGAQTAPLGRAVIGGLIAATFATLFVLPGVYAIFQAKAHAGSISLDPADPESRWYEA